MTTKTPGEIPAGVDPTRPTTARMYDFILGGTNNFDSDRQVVEKLKAGTPDLVDTILANRGFHGRAAVWMARQGIRQFIDLGSGLPTQNNTHQSVRRVAADAAVVYVDADPMVAAHSAGLLTGDGSTAVIAADIRDFSEVFSHPDVQRLIDLTQPAGLLATDVMHFLADDSDPWGLTARYMDALAPGSYLALSHVTGDNLPSRPVEEGIGTLEKAAVEVHLRSRAQVERFFDGLELVAPHEGAAPALTYTGVWGAEDPQDADTDGSRGFYCAVARRPEAYGRPGS